MQQRTTTGRDTTSMDSRPIPAFYCCYLLRSSYVKASKRYYYYIGSTPHPRRRLAQHNREEKGGAFQTRHEKRRPWEMTCIVTGFPSRIAALQFEWAWQNFHITKKVTGKQREEESIKSSKPAKSKRPAEGQLLEASASEQQSQKKKRPKRPQVTLSPSLAHLHALLRVPSFNRWPLGVRFFCKEVHQKWIECSKKASDELRDNLYVTADIREAAELKTEAEKHTDLQTGRKRKFAPSGVGGVEGIDVSYTSLKPHVEKSIGLLTEHLSKQCVFCAENIRSPDSTVLTCPEEECSAAFHMGCIAKEQPDMRKPDEVLPTSIRCPRCRREQPWIDLAKELSVRVRGVKDLAQLTNVARKRPVSSILKNGVTMESKDLVDMKIVQSIDDNLTGTDFLDVDPEDEPLPDSWHEISEASDDESVVSTDVGFSDRPFSDDKPIVERRLLPVVIEDSEWDSAEILD